MDRSEFKRAIGALTALALAGVQELERDPAPRISYPRKTKPKQGGRNPLRGYYARYSHALTELQTDANLARMANK